MLKQFIRNEDGNYAVIFSLMMLPILGAVGMSVDFSNISRLKYELGSAIDSAGSAAALSYQAGDITTQTELENRAKKYFYDNFDANYKDYVTVTLTMPIPNDPDPAKRELKTKASLQYHPYFGPMMAALTNSNANNYVTIIEENSMKLQMRAEIALVLDNSGSMSDPSGTGTRLDLLKAAAKGLIADTINVSSTLTGVEAPVRFSLVPFAGSVNIGASHVNDTWMDRRGVSPVQHENLNWGIPSVANPTGYRTLAADGAKLDASGNPLTRISILNALKYQTGGSASAVCSVSKTSGACAINARTGTALVNAAVANPAKYSWGGCVESRPNPYNLTDETPNSATPKTLFVPYFAPDEFNAVRYDTSLKSSKAYNNWWPDLITDVTGVNLTNTILDPTGGGAAITTNAGARSREINVAKYFQEQPYLTTQLPSFSGVGPNAGCTTSPIQALTEDVPTLNTAIDAMQPNGATNVTEGMAWGWRTVSSGAPFTEANPETRKDINKVVIVVTDGRNTYYTPGSLGYKDYALNQSIYSAQGYPAWNGNTGVNQSAIAASAANKGRIFEGTGQAFNAYNNNNYTPAMIEQMNTLCTNIKNGKIMLMTIALDLDPVADATMITGLSACAGDSRNRKNSDGTPKKLFWNANSATLTSAFNEITDELSNLRFTN